MQSSSAKETRDISIDLILTPVRYNLWISVPLFTLLYWSASMVPALIVRKIPRVNKLF